MIWCLQSLLFFALVHLAHKFYFKICPLQGERHQPHTLSWHRVVLRLRRSWKKFQVLPRIIFGTGRTMAPHIWNSKWSCYSLFFSKGWSNPRKGATRNDSSCSRLEWPGHNRPGALSLSTPGFFGFNCWHIKVIRCQWLQRIPGRTKRPDQEN